jgi:hypothetical protein
VHFFYSSSIQLITFPHIQLNVQLPHLIAARAHFSGQPVYPWQGTPSDTEEEERQRRRVRRRREKEAEKKTDRQKTGKTLIPTFALQKKKGLRRRVRVHSCNFKNSPSLSLSHL